MKKIIIASIVFLLSTGSCLWAQSFEGVIAVKGDGGHVATFYVKGDKVRMETDDEGDPYALLYSAKSDKINMLRPREKRYAEVPYINRADASTDESGSISKTGETKQLHGYKCERWLVSDGKSESEIWVTDQIGVDYSLVLTPMVRIGGTGWHHMAGYFPMKMASIGRKGKSMIFLEVTSIEKRALGDDLFSIPAGFQKL